MVVMIKPAAIQRGEKKWQSAAEVRETKLTVFVPVRLLGTDQQPSNGHTKEKFYWSSEW